MRHGRSYTRDTLGPCALCWREVGQDEPCVWNAARRMWQHCDCRVRTMALRRAA